LSAGRLPKQLGDLSRITFSGHAKWKKNRREVESHLEALELPYLLTVLKNDSMNLIFGYVISYDFCCHHRMNANELLSYMIALVIISE
jgi:hypothetical protein